MTTAAGGCLCGAIRYEVSAEPIFQLACFCRDCQYTSGGAPTLAVAVPKPALKITRGEPRTYWVAADSGAKVGRSFCGACGTPLFSEPSGIGEIAVIKVGSLDDPSMFKVQVDIWMKSAQPWHRPHEGAAQFETSPATPGR
ncbi:MAG TPA: GFA family protein [Caulobacteraceae bacterium]